MPFVEKNFPVSTKREDTFAAGLSMGGYGALRLALEKPERFAACASLSGAIDLEETYKQAQRGGTPDPFNWDALLGDPAHIAGSDADLFALILKLKEQKRPLPRICQIIGTEDFLYQINLGAKKKLEDLGVDLTWAEHPGKHDWIFWDTYIRDVLNWMAPRS
jgi:S-formylglutathione hydrolase FrmB